MERFLPDFEIIKMDAEVASYQEDFDSEDDRRGDAHDAAGSAAPASTDGAGA